MPVVLDSRRHLLDDSLLDFSSTTHDESSNISSSNFHQNAQGARIMLILMHMYIGDIVYDLDNDDSNVENDRRILIKKSGGCG